VAADTLTQYKLTGQLPNGGAAGLAGLTSPKKRGKKPKLNKDGSEKQPRKPTAYNAWMQSKVRRSMDKHCRPMSCTSMSRSLHPAHNNTACCRALGSLHDQVTACCVLHMQLKELKEAVGHDPDQKHVDTFKQAAHIWAELPREEKERINAEFRVRPQCVAAPGGLGGAPAPMSHCPARYPTHRRWCTALRPAPGLWQASATAVHMKGAA
jgi:hypothetical protein